MTVSTAVPSKDIFWALRPTYCFLRILGFAPFTVEGPERDRYIKYSKLYDIITYIVHAVRILMGIYVTYNYRNFARMTTSLTTLTYVAYTSFLYLTFISHILLNKVETKNVMRLWQKVYNIEQSLLAAEIKTDVQKIRRTSVLHIISEILIIVVYPFVLHCDEMLNLTIFHYVIYIHICINRAACLTQLFTLFRIMTDYFKQLDNILNRAGLKSVPETLKINFILKAEEVYQETCAALRDTVNVFGLLLLIEFACYFWILILEGYFLFLYVCNYDSHLFLSVIFYWIFYFVFKIMMSIVTAEYCCQQAKKIKRTLVKIVMLEKSGIVRKQAKAFSLTVLHEEIKITAAGYFSIDYTLIFSIVSAVTAHLVLLIQFHLTSVIVISADVLTIVSSN